MNSDYLFILNTNGEYLTSFMHHGRREGSDSLVKAHADCNNIENTDLLLRMKGKVIDV